MWLPSQTYIGSEVVCMNENFLIEVIYILFYAITFETFILFTLIILFIILDK